MKCKPLNEAHLRRLLARAKEFVVTDDARHPTDHGTLSLCMRVYPTGRKLWAVRLRQSRRQMHTLGVFAPGAAEHLSLEAARQLLAEIAGRLQADPIAAEDLDAAMDRAITDLRPVRHNAAPVGDTQAASAPNVPRAVPVAALADSIRQAPIVHQTVGSVAWASVPGTDVARVVRMATPVAAVPPKPESVVAAPSLSWRIHLSAIATNAANAADMAKPTVGGAPTLPEPASGQRNADQASGATVAASKGGRYTLKDVVDRYIEQLIGAGKAGSARDYRSLFRRRVLEPYPEVAHRPADQITSADITDLVRATMVAPRRVRNRSAGARHMDPAQAHKLPMKREADKLRVMLKGAFNAIMDGDNNPNLPRSESKTPHIVSNPALTVVPVKGAIQRGERVLTADEMAAVVMRLGTIPSVAAHAIEACLWLGGQRLAQVVRAEVLHFDPDAATLLIFDPKGRRETPRQHLLPVRGRARELLENCAARASALKPQPSPFLFTTTGRSPMDVQTASDLLATVKSEMMALGFIRADFDVRDLRRTIETRLASRGVTKDVRAHLLSHGLGGVQDAHYNRYEYFDEKVRAIGILHQWLEHAVRDFVRRNGDVIPCGIPMPDRPRKSPQRQSITDRLPHHGRTGANDLWWHRALLGGQA